MSLLSCKYNNNNSNNERLLCLKCQKHRTGTLQYVRIIKERAREEKCFKKSFENVN